MRIHKVIPKMDKLTKKVDVIYEDIEALFMNQNTLRSIAVK